MRQLQSLVVVFQIVPLPKNTTLFHRQVAPMVSFPLIVDVYAMLPYECKRLAVVNVDMLHAVSIIIIVHSGVYASSA